MATLNIENSFLTENRSVLNFLNQSGQGLYIPLYQREYSWDSENIEQLLEEEQISLDSGNLTRYVDKVEGYAIELENERVK